MRYWTPWNQAVVQLWAASILCYHASLVIAAATPTVSWTSPTKGDGFLPGETIVATWESSQKIISPSFTLCTKIGNGDQCGEAVWPMVDQQDSQYSMSIVAPDIASHGSFYLKMKSDLGDDYSSPGFDLAATQADLEANKAQTKAEVMPMPMDAALTNSSTTHSSNALTSTSTSPSSSAVPSTPASSPRKGPNPVAVGVPLTLFVVAILGAFAFLISKKSRTTREAGGASTSQSLGPGNSTTNLGGSVPSTQSTSTLKKATDQTFFNISLNKTESELSVVEKAVVGAISAGVASAGGDGEKAKCEEPAQPCAKQIRTHGERGEDRRYTAHPPHHWRRSGYEHPQGGEFGQPRSRERYERPSDNRWEDLDYDYAWDWHRRNQKGSMIERNYTPEIWSEMHHSGGWRSRNPDYHEDVERTRRVYGDSWHPSSGSRILYEEPPRNPYEMRQCRTSLPNWQNTGPPLYAPHEPRPPSAAQSLPDSYSRTRDYSSSQQGPRSLTPRKPTRANDSLRDLAFNNSRPSRHELVSSPMNPENHSSLSVISSYLAPSPCIPTTSGFSNTPYMLHTEQMPPPLRDGEHGRFSPTEPVFPPGLAPPSSMPVTRPAAQPVRSSSVRPQLSRFAFECSRNPSRATSGWGMDRLNTLNESSQFDRNAARHLAEKALPPRPIE